MPPVLHLCWYGCQTASHMPWDREREKRIRLNISISSRVMLHAKLSWRWNITSHKYRNLQLQWFKIFILGSIKCHVILLLILTYINKLQLKVKNAFLIRFSKNVQWLKMPRKWVILATIWHECIKPNFLQDFVDHFWNYSSDKGDKDNILNKQRFFKKKCFCILCSPSRLLVLG